MSVAMLQFDTATLLPDRLVAYNISKEPTFRSPADHQSPG
jgi:hypothetical protein